MDLRQVKTRIYSTQSLSNKTCLLIKTTKRFSAFTCPFNSTISHVANVALVTASPTVVPQGNTARDKLEKFVFPIQVHFTQNTFMFLLRSLNAGQLLLTECFFSTFETIGIRLTSHSYNNNCQLLD